MGRSARLLAPDRHGDDDNRSHVRRLDGLTDDHTDAEPTSAAASDGDTAAAPTEDATELLDTSAAPTPDTAWSAETSSQPVADYMEDSRWRGVLPKVLFVLAASLAIGATAVLILKPGHQEPAKPRPSEAPVTQAAPTVRQAAPTSQPAARMVGHTLQLQGTPEQWDAVTAELARQGIDVTISTVGVITELKFANYDRAPDNWVRWYAEHVPQNPNPIREGSPISMLLASEHGLPVPPPPAICYTNDGTPVATAAFDPAMYGSYAEHCGPTPGALAGH